MSGSPGQDVIRLMVVEDHPALRQGLELLLGRQACVVVGSAGRADDVFVGKVDVDDGHVGAPLPDQVPGGVALARRLLADDPDLGVLLYTGAEDRKTLGEVLDCGAQGFAVKAAPPHELIDAIRTVARGGAYIDPRLKPMLRTGTNGEKAHVLSPREREILDLLSKGLTGEDAAARLSCWMRRPRSMARPAPTGPKRVWTRQDESSV